MKKRIAVCCVGQLRNGRFLMKNHKYWIIDYYISLGYIVDLYIYTDKYNVMKTSFNISDYIITHVNEEHIYNYYNYMKCDTEIHKILIEENSSIINLNNTLRIKDDKYFIGQIEKYYNILKLIKTSNIEYDIIIRFRFDSIFNTYPPEPIDNEIIQNKIKKLDYISDQIHIFNGLYLNNLLTNFNNLDLKLLSDKLESKLYNVEGFFNEIFISSGLKLSTYNDIAGSYCGLYNQFITHANWEYYNDYFTLHTIPYKRNTINKILKLRKTMSNLNLFILSDYDLINKENINLYNYIDNNDDIEFQKLAVSAFEPTNIICNKDHILYDFVTEYISINNITGIIPLAGNATRMKHLPKFLLPCRNGVSLIDNTIESFNYMNIYKISAGVSENNNNLLIQYSSFDKHIIKSSTMAETVYKLVELNKYKKYVLIMPDTYFKINTEIKNIGKMLDYYKIVVCLWNIQPWQIGKVGQCNVKDGKIIDIIDKDNNCTYKYLWGIIAWTSDLNELINPTWETIGNLIKIAIENNINIGTIYMPGIYYDCGTYNEYFSLIKNEI